MEKQDDHDVEKQDDSEEQRVHSSLLLVVQFAVLCRQPTLTSRRFVVVYLLSLPFFPCAFRAPFFQPQPFFLPPFSYYFSSWPCIVSLSGEFSRIVSSAFEGEAIFPSCSSHNVSSTGEFLRIVLSTSGWVVALSARLGDPERCAAAPHNGAWPVGIMIEKDDQVRVASAGREPVGGAGGAGLDEPVSATGWSAGDSLGGAFSWHLVAAHS
jgi:hypothetical protein